MLQSGVCKKASTRYVVSLSSFQGPAHGPKDGRDLHCHANNAAESTNQELEKASVVIQRIRGVEDHMGCTHSI